MSVAPLAMPLITNDATVLGLLSLILGFVFIALIANIQSGKNFISTSPHY